MPAMSNLIYVHAATDKFKEVLKSDLQSAGALWGENGFLPDMPFKMLTITEQER